MHVPAPCPGCGVVAEPADGPTHPYIGASPGCWAVFGELMTSPLGPDVTGQLALDTYAAQHPGVPERRAIQSVCVHLVSLCAALERGYPPERAPELLQRAVGSPPAPWRWLDPVLPLGTVTVADAISVPPGEERGRSVRRWGEDVWAAYGGHHAEVRTWLDRLLG